MSVYQRLPNWLRAGLATAFFIGVPGFLLSVIGWLQEVAEWAAGEPVAFPDLSALRQGAVALVLAVLIGGINAIIRWAQERAKIGSTPVYVTTKPR